MKRISARDSHDTSDTHDHSEITASDVIQDDGSTKRGSDVSIIASPGILANKISTTDYNSRDAATLAAGATFQGVGEDVSMYGRVGVSVKSTNATDATVYMEVSHDGVTWGGPPRFWSDTSVAAPHMWNIVEKYFRIRYVNGTTEAQDLSIQVQYSINADTTLAHQLNESLAPDVEATAVRPSNFSDEVVIGRRSGVSHFNKFGYREGLTAAAGEETIWATTGNFVPMTVASTFTITYTPASDGSTSTGAHTLYFVYIDSNGLSQIGLHTLGSSGSDVTSFSGLGINRCAVSVCGSNQTNGAVITVTETTGATTQAVIPAGEGTTQQTIFHCDANSDAVTKYLWINTNKLSGGGSPRLVIKGWVFNRQFEVKFEVFRLVIDTGAENTVFLNEPVGFKLSPTDVLYFTADTDTNNAIVNMRFSLLEYKRD